MDWEDHLVHLLEDTLTIRAPEGIITLGIEAKQCHLKGHAIIVVPQIIGYAYV